ncbi:hypothetical protein TNCV_1547071 [Trichonephila clavipes]|nr:hypothetical protein TNCV_1547071 [Trichonephila clavipes]
MVASSIVMFYSPFGNFPELNRTDTCMVLKAKANERRTSSPLPDEFLGSRSDSVRQSDWQIGEEADANVYSRKPFVISIVLTVLI